MGICKGLGIGIGWGLMGSGAIAQSAPPRYFEAVAITGQEVRCYWLSDQKATGYRLERDGKPIATLPAETQEYRDTNLAPDTPYSYTLRVLSPQGETTLRSLPERTFTAFPSPHDPRSLEYDVVVVQASSSGVAAAIEAARRGYKTLLIEPTTRFGGMPVNGLSATDLRRPQYASGFLVRFRDRVRALYAAEGVRTTGLFYEPRLSHQAMKSLLYETPNLSLLARARLLRVHTRDKTPDGSRRKVEAITIEELGTANRPGRDRADVGMENRPTGRRATIRAKIFIDATDSGDLAAWAGAPFRLGREPRTPAEPHNGVIYYDRANDAYLPGSTGQGDKRLQSYAYLLTVKDYGKGSNQAGTPLPSYRADDFVHTPPWPQSWAVTSGKLPNNKYEINQHPQGSDYQEINYRYPIDSYAERERVERLYRERVLNYLHAIQTVQGQASLGLPDDEYRETGGFPPLLYVREGRRIEGEQLPLEREITEARQIIRPESVGIGDYPMDSHAVRPKTDWTTPDMGEGEWWLYKQTPWYPIPFGIIVPKRLTNVFVSTAVSSTHVSYGTFRMEPVRMAMGQAAGVAAALAVRYGLEGREVPVRQVQDELLPSAANPVGNPSLVLHWLKDVPFGHPHYRAIQYLAARGFWVAPEEFRPNEPTTRAELIRWLELLAQRSPTLSPAQVARVTTSVSAIPTRAEITQALTTLLGWRHDPKSPVFYVESDSHPQREAMEALAQQGIDARLWDGVAACAPQGKYRFQPDAPLTHTQMFATLYLVQLTLGPRFYDNPVDFRNGRVRW